MLGAKEQIVDNIRSVDTILVTVGQDPTVDELSAALGLTTFLNDIGKHATTVVSSTVPAAMGFLHAEDAFERTVDSLRDFVIALDKEKADHLRYKVDGDLVKIFVTPYRTVITDKDLHYSKGDYNVEMVLALGASSKTALDKAVAAHSQILQDSVVATIGLKPSQLGAPDWANTGASSVCELVTELVEDLSEERAMSQQVANALLTGVVAATDRFSNDRTTSHAMTVAANLMAAGANQQLIVAKLKQGNVLDIKPDDGGHRLTGDIAGESERQAKASKKSAQSGGAQGKGKANTASKKPKTTPAPQPVDPSQIDPSKIEFDPSKEYDPAQAFDTALKRSEERRVERAHHEGDDLASELSPAPATPAPYQDNDLLAGDAIDSALADFKAEMPATTQPPAKANASLPPVVLGGPGSKPATKAPAPTQPSGTPAPALDALALAEETMPSFEFTDPTPAPPTTAPATPKPAGGKTTQLPATTAPPSDGKLPGTPPPPPIPDFSQLPPLPTGMPDFSDLPGAGTDLPPENLGTILPPTAPASGKDTKAPAAPSAKPSDPGEFHIPGA